MVDFSWWYIWFHKIVKKAMALLDPTKRLNTARCLQQLLNLFHFMIIWLHRHGQLSVTDKRSEVCSQTCHSWDEKNMEIEYQFIKHQSSCTTNIALPYISPASQLAFLPSLMLLLFCSLRLTDSMFTPSWV